jgi:hypothetical protein
MHTHFLAVGVASLAPLAGAFVTRSRELHALQAPTHPSSSVGGLRLAHVFVHDEEEGTVTHHHMPKSVHDQRRLDGTYEVTSGCCSLSTERERVRTSAALNWHLYPPGEAYDDVYDEVLGEAAWDRQDIWDQGQGIYAFGWESSQTPTEQAEAYEVYLRAQQEIFANYLLSDVDTSSWDPRHEPMSRYGEGTQDATGVALGVYEAADGTQMLVFRGSYSYGDFDNVRSQPLTHNPNHAEVLTLRSLSPLRSLRSHTDPEVDEGLDPGEGRRLCHPGVGGDRGDVHGRDEVSQGR